MNVYTSHGNPERYCYLCESWLDDRERFNDHLLSKKHRRCLDKRLFQLAGDYLFQNEIILASMPHPRASLTDEWKAHDLSQILRSTSQDPVVIKKFALCPVCQTLHLPVTTDPFEEHYHWVSENFASYTPGKARPRRVERVCAN